MKKSFLFYALSVLLCAAAALGAATASDSAEQSASASASLGGAAEDCFRGYSIGTAYHYEFRTMLQMEKKTFEGETITGQHQRTGDVEVDAVITPLSIDEKNHLNFRLEITHAHFMDRAGFDDYTEDGRQTDATYAEAQLLEALSSDFYYTQRCDMHIESIHHKKSEKAFATNMKTALVTAFSHKLLVPGAADFEENRVNRAAEQAANFKSDSDEALLSYERAHRDHMGDLNVKYEHYATMKTGIGSKTYKRDAAESVGGGGVRVVSKHDSVRHIAMQVHAAPDKSIEADHAEHREAHIARGVVHEAFYRQEHRLPSANYVDELKEKAERAKAETLAKADPDYNEPEQEAVAHGTAFFEQWTFGETRATLTETRKRQMKRSEPTTVKSMRHFLTTKRDLGDVDEWISREAHMDESEKFESSVGRGPHDPRTLEELMLATEDEDTSHMAWREIVWRLRDDAAYNDEKTLLAEVAPLLHTRSGVPDTQRHHLITALLTVGHDAHINVLLDLVEDDEVDEDTKHWIFHSMSILRAPSAAVIKSFEARLYTLNLATALGKNIALAYGSLASQLHLAGEAQRAHDMRELLLTMLLRGRKTGMTMEERAVLVFSLNNSLTHIDVKNDVSLRNLTMGRWLQEAYFNFPSEDFRYGRDPKYTRNVYRERLTRLERAAAAEWHAEAEAAAAGGESPRSFFRKRAEEYHRRKRGCFGARKRCTKIPFDPKTIDDSKVSGWNNWMEGWSIQSLPEDANQNWGMDSSTGLLGKDDAGACTSDFSGACDGIGSPPPPPPADGKEGEMAAGDSKDEKESRDLLPECKGVYFLDQVSCELKMYDHWRPNPRRAPGKWFEEKLGSGKFYAMMEGDLHLELAIGDGVNTPLFRLEFFAGAQFSASLLGKKTPILGAYARANVSTGTRSQCGWFSFGLYYQYFNKIHFFGVDMPDCIATYTTCKPWFPGDQKAMGKMNFLNIVIFSISQYFQVGPVPMMVFVEGIGKVDMGYTIDMLFGAPMTDDYGNELGSIDFGGGTMLNGIVEPGAGIDLACEVGIGIPLVSFGIGVQLTIISLSFPITIGINFITGRPCLGMGMKLSALGGRFYIWLRIGICGGFINICIKIDKTIYAWEGLGFECVIFTVNCCKGCPGACNNGWCDYKIGECQCNDHWGGAKCQMECPRDCDYSLAPNAGDDPLYINEGVMCDPTPDPNTNAFATCNCYYGYFGWNCEKACKGMIVPGEPCNNNGICGAMGTQDLVSAGGPRGAGGKAGAEERIEDTLSAVCQCYDNFFGDDCSYTCEPDENGVVCPGGKCVFDYTAGNQRAWCQCLKGYAGPKCEAKCPLFRGSPCGYRGNCYDDEGTIACHCERGFSGEGCDRVDESGSGRSCLFDGRNWHIEIEQASYLMDNSQEWSIMLWFFIDGDVPEEAELVRYPFGRVVLRVDEDSGEPIIEMCDNRNNKRRDGCLQATIRPPTNQWAFVVAGLHDLPIEHVKHLWVGYHGGGSCSGQDVVMPESNWCVNYVSRPELIAYPVIKDTMIIGGVPFKGAVDHILVHKDLPSIQQINDRIHHVQSPLEPDLRAHWTCDEGRGNRIYSNAVEMIGGEFVFLNDSFDYSLYGPDLLWGNPGGIELLTGAEYSTFHDLVQIAEGGSGGGEATVNANTPDVEYYSPLAGGRVATATLHFNYVVPLDVLCDIEIVFIDQEGTPKTSWPLTVKEPDGSNKRYLGEGTEVIELNANLLGSLRKRNTLRFNTNANRIQGSDLKCNFFIDQTFLEVTMAASTTTVEFKGQSSAYVKVEPTPTLRNDFSITLWMFRPTFLHSQSGLLAAIVPDTQEDGALDIDGPFLLYESGKPFRGLHFETKNHSPGQKVLAGGHGNYEDAYVLPVGEWVHKTVIVEHVRDGGAGHVYYDGSDPKYDPGDGWCRISFAINGFTGSSGQVGTYDDGKGEVFDYPTIMPDYDDGLKPNYCGYNSDLRGWGESSYQLRIGPKYLGQLNDFFVWNRAVSLTEVQETMNVLYDWNDPSWQTGLVMGLDFSGYEDDENQEATITRDKAAGKSGTTARLKDGVHAGLIWAVPLQIENCPGVTDETPERVCGAEPTHGHGRCEKPRGREDPRIDPASSRPASFKCVCDAGYVSGYTGDCDVECPSTWRFPCSGHGECRGELVMIKPENSTSVPTNDTDTGSGALSDRTEPVTVVSCICDRGFVGDICEHECPCWSSPINRPQRICQGAGFCNFTADGAYCTCHDTSQRDGFCCENLYGTEPDAVVTDCGPCDGPGEVCDNGFCSCTEGYFRVFGTCRTGNEFAVGNNLGATIGAIIGALIGIAVIVGAGFAVWKFKLQSRMV